jgi:cytochrome P450
MRGGKERVIDQAVLPPFDHHSPEHSDLWVAQTDSVRAEGAVAWTPANGGHWFVVGYPEVRAAALDWRTFSSFHDITGLCPAAQGIGIPPLAFALILSESDPPLSTQRRKLELPHFRTTNIRQWGPVVESNVENSLASIGPAGCADLFADFAMPVVARTTMELVGIDLDRWREFTLAVHHGGQGIGDDPTGDMERVHSMLGELARERRRQPRADIVSALVGGEVEGRALSDEEVVSMLSALVLGGFDTTASIVASALIWLSDNRRDHQRLVSDRAFLQNAVDEFLRFFPSAVGVGRNVMVDVELGGQLLAAGDRVFLSWAAANRDPAVFEDPHQVRLDRPNAGRHLSFGVGGHLCLGAELARLITANAISTLLQRLPDYSVDRRELVRYASPGVVVGWSKVPARFTPVAG